MSARDGRHSPSRGEQLPKPDWLDLGGCDNPASTAQLDNAARSVRTQSGAPHVSHAAPPKSCAEHDSHAVFANSKMELEKSAAARTTSRVLEDERAQKLQRCALLTRKSRNACTRATDFNSSG